MTPPENSPQAQEVKLLPCPKCQSTNVSLDYGAMDRNGWSVSCNSCGIQTGINFNEFLAITSWNTRAPNENQPPLAEKTPTPPQLSGQLPAQSEGNREKDVVKIKDAMIVEAMRCIVQMQDNVISKDEVDDIILRLGLCVAAMNSQGGKP